MRPHSPVRPHSPTPAAAGPPAAPRPPEPPAPRRRVRTAVTAVLLAALTAVVTLTVRTGGDLGHPQRLLWWYAAAWALFAAAAWLVRRVPVRAAAALILVGSVALAAAALTAAPRTSDDMYRYAWDGRVQTAGVSPYAYPPDAPQLARLRDPWLFPPATSSCQGWDHHRDAGLCTRINRPAVHTIYPPVAEGWFLLVHQLSPPGTRHKPLQVAGAVLAVAVTAALLFVLRRRRGDPRRAALWAWCPAVAFGSVNDAHVDTLGVLLAVLAFGVRSGTGRGALLGGAIAVKLLPVLALPGALSGVLRPGRPLRERALQAARVLPAALLVVALSYLPYVLLSGTGVIGYLPGYLQEEGYDQGDGGRFAVLQVLGVPESWAGPVTVVLIAATAVYVLLRGDSERPWRGALLVTGAALLGASSAYYWYALLVVALVALDGRWEWLAVPAAAMVVYVGNALRWHGLGTAGWPFGIATVLIAAATAARIGLARQRRELPANGGRPPGAA